MEKIIRNNLDLSNKDNVFAGIYAVRDDTLWAKSFKLLHNNKETVTQEVKEVKDFLEEKVGIKRSNIPAKVLGLRNEKGDLHYPDHALGQYEYAEISLAIRLDQLFEQTLDQKKIKFWSVDPCKEDVFGYQGKTLTVQEYLGLEQYSKVLQTNPAIQNQTVKYDSLTDSYRGGFFERILNEKEEAHYHQAFQKSQKETIRNATYNSLPFFSLND